MDDFDPGTEIDYLHQNDEYEDNYVDKSLIDIHLDYGNQLHCEFEEQDHLVFNNIFIVSYWNFDMVTQNLIHLKTSIWCWNDHFWNWKTSFIYNYYC